MQPSHSCYLCGLPVRKGEKTLTLSGETLYFCCIGCRMVHTMLTESTPGIDRKHYKETDLYQRCLKAGIIPATKDDLPAHETMVQKQIPIPSFSPSEKSTRLSINLVIKGMWCPACAWVIETALYKTSGIEKVSCSFSTDHAMIQYDPLKTSPRQISDLVRRLGYNAAPLENKADKKRCQKEFVRFFIALLFTVNVMMLSWALYSGFFITLQPEGIKNIGWILFFMTSIVFFYGGMPIHQKAWTGIIHGMPGMESLISIGSTTTFGYSIYNLFTNSIHLYFDTSSMLIVLVLLGKMLEGRAKMKISGDLESFFSIMPNKVRILTDHDPIGRYVSVDQLGKGDLFSVAEGEILPADGYAVRGRATLDLSSLTGEPNPVLVKPGDPVKGGSRLLKGEMHIRSGGSAADSVLGQMIRIMRESLNRKAPLENRFNRVLKTFVPAVVGLSSVTALYLLFSGYPLHEVVRRAVSVVVISCPCALGIAAPLALIAGISSAGKQGILVRDAAAFGQSLNIDTIVFDKTGTLTTGIWQLIDITFSGPFTREEVVALAAGLETDIDHHIAHAILSYAKKCSIGPQPVDHIVHQPNGVCADVSGRKVKLGSFAFIQEPGQPINRRDFHGNGHETGFHSYIYMTIDSQPAARLIFGDRLRPESIETVAQLKRMGYEIMLVSGDSISATKAVAEKIDADRFFGAMLPLEKAELIRQMREKPLHPVMVGDGINDAPAMACAALSIAIYSGSHLGRETASVTLMKQDPGLLIPFFSLSARVTKKVRQNLLFACFYNLLAIPVAMNGLLNPLVAATAMLFSSLTVIGNTLLLVKSEHHRIARKNTDEQDTNAS